VPLSTRPLHIRPDPIDDKHSMAIAAITTVSAAPPPGISICAPSMTAASR